MKKRNYDSKDFEIIKKDLTQMTGFEQIKLMNEINRIANYRRLTINYHATRRMRDRSISFSKVKNTLKYGIIVEYTLVLKDGKIFDERVKLRRLNSKRIQTNIVVSLISKNIITVYNKDSFRDVNRTLNPNIYNKNLNIFT